MKKLSLLLLAVLTVFTLSACKRDNTIKSGDFITTYAGHYETLNYLATQSASDSDLFANFVDGLVENDNHAKIIPSLATKWDNEMRNGKQVWSFEIRKGVKWMEKDGTEVADVVAQDWVSAAEYILNPRNNSELIGLWYLFIDGARNYHCSLQVDQNTGTEAPECTEDEGYVYNNSFSQVGVKAVDDNTLEFTLAKPAPYFLTALTYNVFFPVNKEYLQEQGTNFGFDGDSILYNGAYVMDEDEVDAKMSIVKNPKYWDAKNVHINKVTFIYIPDNTNYDWARLKYENNELSGFRVNENDVVGWETYVSGKCYGDQCEGTLLNPIDPEAFTQNSIDKYSYYNLWNFKRVNFDGSSKNQDQKDATAAAVLNTNFRLGFFYGMNKKVYLEYYTPSNPLQWSRNTYSPRELAVDQTGKDYVDFIVEVYAEKNDVTVEKATELLADGGDSHFNEAKAKEFFELAKTELIAGGLEASDFPIIVEFVSSTNSKFIPFQQAFADDFNARYGTIAKFKLNTPQNGDEWTQWNNKKLSYDMRFVMGWGPDYADPSTYLNTYIVNGDMLHYSGFTGQAELQEQVLGSYTDLVKAGDAITDETKLDERFEKFAEAEYNLTFEQAIIIPFLAQVGKNVFVSKVKPYTAARAPYGLAGAKYKYMVILDQPITRDEREQLRLDYEAAK